MKNSKLIKNSIALYSMTIAKLIFPLLTLPYLTRILSVEVYGKVAYVKSLMSYFQVVVDFGFMLSGTKEIAENINDKKKVGYITGEIAFARLIIALMCFVTLLVVSFTLPILKTFKTFTYLSFLVVVLSIFLFDYFFRGIEKMEIISLRYVLMRGISTITTFIVIKNDKDVLWIPVLDIIASIIAIILVYKVLYRMQMQIKIRTIKYIFNEIKVSFLYFVSNMATTIFGAFNTIMIGTILNSSEVAFWSVCMQLIGAVQALYTPITDSIYPQMIKTKNYNFIKRVELFFLPFLLIGCLFTFFMSGWILHIVAGEKYQMAAETLKYLVSVLFFSFFAMLLGWPTLGAIGKAKEVMITTVTAAAFQVLGLLLLVVSNRFNLITIAILRSVTEFVLAVTRKIYCEKYRNEFWNGENG